MKNYIAQLKQMEKKSKYDLINRIVIFMMIPHAIWLWAIISADNFITIKTKKAPYFSGGDEFAKKI